MTRTLQFIRTTAELIAGVADGTVTVLDTTTVPRDGKPALVSVYFHAHDGNARMLVSQSTARRL